MKKTERFLANIWIQISLAGLLTMYALLVKPHDSLSLVWYAVAMGLGLLGAFRQLPVAAFAALLAVAAYGGVLMFQLFVSRSLEELSWHDLVWMIVFPCMAMAGGLNREDRLPKLAGADIGREEWSEADGNGAADKPDLFDEGLNVRVLSGTEFLEALQDCVMSGKRTQSTFYLMLVHIHLFRQFEEKYGDEQANYLLQRTASILHDVQKDTMLKAYLGNGLFALVVPGSDTISPLMIQLRLDNRFRVMLMSRARNDGMVHVRLVHGNSEFPLHGMTADDLYRRAESELEAARKEVER
jgi:diguanylate cyclase (GGDEF)-like protein